MKSTLPTCMQPLWLCLYYPLAVFLMCGPLCTRAYDVVFAVNCGGPSHVDMFGVKYKADNNPVGIASEFGRSLSISNVHPNDMILYQTERYHTSSFSYNIPIDEDGDYVLLSKFSEVYFQTPGGKVFDIALNDHVVASNFDIFAKVGGAAAYDEITRFSIKNGQMKVNEELSDFDGTLAVQFLKGASDNPKINAIVLLKGPVSEQDIPSYNQAAKAAPPRYVEDDSDLPEEAETQQKFKKTSGPKVRDPYASDDSWFMPIAIVVAAFLPVLFFLCRVRT